MSDKLKQDQSALMESISRIMIADFLQELARNTEDGKITSQSVSQAKATTLLGAGGEDKLEQAIEDVLRRDTTIEELLNSGDNPLAVDVWAGFLSEVADSEPDAEERSSVSDSTQRDTRCCKQ